MVKPELIKLLDRVGGRIVAAMLLSPSSAPLDRDLLRSVLIVRPGGIGDAVLLIPAIVALKANLPAVTITVLAERRNGAVFSLCPAIDRLLHYDAPSELMSAIRGTYDVVIDTEQWHRLSAVVARLTGAPLLVGYATNERKRLFGHPVEYSQENYEAESFFDLLVPLGIEKPSAIQVPFLKVPSEATEKIEKIIGDLAGHPFITIFPGASIPERRWGVEKFREVAERLQAKGSRVVVVGGREDASAAEEIVSGISGLNLAGRTSLAETAAVIAKSALLISGDSGILHIAVGLGKPTVSLFGPGIAKKWAPLGEDHIVINKNLSCSPCTKFGYTPRCSINVRCMSEISVDEVTTSVFQLIKRHGNIDG